MHPDTLIHRALADDSRIRILSMLRQAGRPFDTRALADETGLHSTTVRAHLELLVEAGLVIATREQRSTVGRPRILYEAVSDPPDAAGTAGYRLLAEILVNHIGERSRDPVAHAVEAGEAWGASLVERPPPQTATSATAAREELLALLDRLGFCPETTEDESCFRLRCCPFLDVARNHQDVVCSVHLGLMDGALAALNAPVGIDSLEPFAEPAACLARWCDIDS